MDGSQRWVRISDADVLNLLLHDAGVVLAPETDFEATRRSVAAAVNLLAKTPANDRAPLRIMHRDRHIPLKVVLWELATACISLLGSSLTPSGLSAPVGAASIVKALFSLGQRITSLTDSQVAVCHAVARICADKKRAGRILAESGASVVEIGNFLANVSPAITIDVEDMLEDMTPAVLRRSKLPAGTFYELVP